MAMKREYLSVDGEIFGEVTNGVVNFYDRDALGSVVAIEDGAGNTVSTIEYKPFGDVRTYTGENPLSSPRRFLWCGTWGYRFNERYAQYTSHYVRARHYSSLQGMWSTVDPLYPSERAYGYVENRVTVGIDPTGKWCYGQILNKGLFENYPQSFIDSVSAALKNLANDPNMKEFLRCLGGHLCEDPDPINTSPDPISKPIGAWIAHNCTGETNNNSNWDFVIERDTGGIHSLCTKGKCANTDLKKSPPVILICPLAYLKGKCGDLKCLLAHEFIHAAGYYRHSVAEHEDAFLCVKKLKGCENYTGTTSG